MTDHFVVYVSAAADLAAEREAVGRAVTEIPVSLGWRIVQSPLRDEPVDLESLAQSDLHFLLMGGDIRAPIGTEWISARRLRRQVYLLLKTGIPQTAAARDFVRFVGGESAWQPFRDTRELRLQILTRLADMIRVQALRFALTTVELGQLQDWRESLESAPFDETTARPGGAGESGIVLSPERYEPSSGILLQPNKG